MDIRKCIDSFWLTMLHPWLSQEIPLSSKKSRKPFHNPPQPTVLPNLGAFISSNIPPEHHEWLHHNVLGALAETYMFQTGSQKKISSTENYNKLLSF